MRGRHALALLPTALLPIVLLAGCASTVALTPATQATSVGCAGVIARTRTIPAIGQSEQRLTDAQGTAAWGTPQAVTLTCGVDVPGPTTTQCFPYGDVSWLTENRSTSAGERVILTSFGREPAVQVVVDSQAVSVSDVVAALSEPVDDATRANGRRCLTASDAPVPSATP